MRVYILLGLLALMIFISGCIQEEEKLEELEHIYIDLTPAEAKELIATNTDLIIIDVSPLYAQEHIPNAVNYYIDNGSLDRAIPTLDKKGKYLVYCQSEGASIEGAQKLIDAGFSNVYRLEGNYDAWVAAGYEVEKPTPAKLCVDICGDGECQDVVCTGEGCPCAETPDSCPEDCIEEAEIEISYTNVTPKEAKELIEKNTDLIVIDVSLNYSQGHIPNAVNYPIVDGSFDDAIPTLDVNKQYLVYCHTDAASIAGAQKLIDAGFDTVYRLQGNYAAWVDAGYEVVKPAIEAAREEVHEAGIITIDELSKHNNKQDCWIGYKGKVYDITNLIVGMIRYPRCGTSYTTANVEGYYDVTNIEEVGILVGTLETST